MIKISAGGQEHFQKLLSTQEEGTSIRVFVVNPGTPHAECGVSYCPKDAVEKDDLKLEFDKFNAYVDEDSIPYLEEAEIDYQTDEMGGQLTAHSEGEGKGAVMFGNEMIDEASRKMALKFISRGERAGRKRSPQA